MQAKTESFWTRKVTLELSQQEADWLHGVMQNPLSDNELPIDREMRLAFFTVTGAQNNGS